MRLTVWHTRQSFDPDQGMTPRSISHLIAYAAFLIAVGVGITRPENHLASSISLRKVSAPPVLADRILVNEKMINFFSVFTNEPEDSADTHVIPDTKQAGYVFPIEQVKRYRDNNGLIRLEGTIYLRGDASATAIPLLNQFFSNAGGKSRLGSQYLVRIRFAAAGAGTSNPVEVTWLTAPELAEYDKGNQKLVIGFTKLGSDRLKINPIYADARSMATAFADWPINRKQLRETVRHTRGVFAHEMIHAMGLSHMRNNTRSMASYAYGRYVNGNDARAICLLASEADELLCPE